MRSGASTIASNTPCLGIILPAFNEAEVIAETIATLERVVSPHVANIHFVVVDDGSTDGTWYVLGALHRSNPAITAIRLSRNFGKEQSIHAGLAATHAEWAIVMDADLQHPPETIVTMLEAQRESGASVVHAQKSDRSEHESASSFLVRTFYHVHRLCTGLSLSGATDFKLLSRPVIDAYVALPERDRFFRGLIPWLGFSQHTIEFTIAARSAGRSKWSNFRRLTTGLGAIRSFSALPLQLITIVGFLFLLGAVLLGAYTVYQWWTDTAIAGFSTVILLLLIVGSSIMISLGIIGQYLAEMFAELKGRPAYVISDTLTVHDQSRA